MRETHALDAGCQSVDVVDALVTVEPVEARTQLRRFRDIPYVLHGHDDRWRMGVRAFESWRLDARRHPYFDRGDAAYFLARRAGRPVGRIAAHHDGSPDGPGRFGFYDVPDDEDVVVALLDAARDWLVTEGRSSMTGPVSWTPEEEFGVRVEGFEHRAITGRPWHPPWYAESLRRAGLAPGELTHTYRLSTDVPLPTPPTPPASGRANRPGDGDLRAQTREGGGVPPHAGGYRDEALVLPGIAAVPDVSQTLERASLRSAWREARRVHQGGFDTAVCVRCEGDPAVLVPELARAAREAGYGFLISPWAPDGRAPETVNQVFTDSW